MSDDREDRYRSERPERRPSDGERRERGRREDDDDRPPPPGSSGVKTVLIVLGIVGLLGFCLVGTAVGVVVYLVGQARNAVTAAAARMETSNNHKEIALAMHEYHDRHGKFPPVAMPTKTPGKKGLSWRVAILPQLRRDDLYRQFKLDEPWDHPDNMRLASQMPDVFAPKRGAGGDRTHIRLFVGPGAIYDPVRPPRGLGNILDGTSNTILLAEAEDPVVWIKPDELTYNPKGSLPRLGRPENDYFIIAMADGSVRMVKKTANMENIKRAVTADGGEIVDFDFD